MSRDVHIEESMNLDQSTGKNKNRYSYNKYTPETHSHDKYGHDRDYNDTTYNGNSIVYNLQDSIDNFFRFREKGWVFWLILVIVVLIILWVYFMKLHSRNAEKQKRLLESYMNRSVDQLERLVVAVEAISEKIDKN